MGGAVSALPDALFAGPEHAARLSRPDLGAFIRTGKYQKDLTGLKWLNTT